MHNTLENFDSQESLSHHTNTIADKVNATMIGISGFGAQLGVFDIGSALMKLPLCLMPSKQKDLLSLQSSRSNAQNRVSLRLFFKFKLCFLSEKEITPESYCKICQTLFSISKVRDKSITKIYVV